MYVGMYNKKMVQVCLPRSFAICTTAGATVSGGRGREGRGVYKFKLHSYLPSNKQIKQTQRQLPVCGVA